MPRYIAIIDEEDGKYGAVFPDAPGCTAMGETEEEVIDNAFEALEEWARDMVADGLEVPKPRTYRQLLLSREYDLGKGGMIATIPLIVETGKSTRANISLDAGLLDAIDEAATRKGLTRSAFLASAVHAKIKAEA